MTGNTTKKAHVATNDTGQTEIPHKDTSGISPMQYPVTLLTGINPAPCGLSTVGELLAGMQAKNQKEREKTLALRKLKSSAPDQYDKAKKNLASFVVGHIAYRDDAPEHWREYAPLLVFDFDELPPETVGALHQKLKNCPLVFAAFPSPASGLRAMVRSNNQFEQHRDAYHQIMAFLSDFTGLPIGKIKKNPRPHIDAGVHNVSRCWYYVNGLAPDELYLNQDSEIFHFKATETIRPILPPTTRPTTQKPAQTFTEAEKWEMLEKMTDTRRSQTANTGRNGRVLFLAQLAHEHGFSEPEIFDYCRQYVEPDFLEPEIKATVKSACKRTAKGKFTPEQQANYHAIGNGANTPAPSDGRKKAGQKKEDNKDSNGSTAKNSYNLVVDYLKSNWEMRFDIVANDLQCRRVGTEKWEELIENDILHELRTKGYKVGDNMLLSLLGSNFVPRFDPFLTYFQGLKYDPIEGDHIDKLTAFVLLKDEAADREFFNAMFKKTLVRVAAAAVGRIAFNKQAFIFMSAQGGGKSTFVRWLCPLPKYRADWTKEEVSDKDGRFALAQNFLINLDEMASFAKADMTQVKALMSLDHIKDRLPYGKRPVRFPRRASFFGSTNKDEFLTDETGTVRWLVFEILGIRHDNGGPDGYAAQVDINRVWAQAWHLLTTGAIDPEMSKEDIQRSEERNKAYAVITPEMEQLLTYVEAAKEGEPGAEFLTTTALTNHLAGLTHIRLGVAQVGAAIRRLSWSCCTKRTAKGMHPVKGYWTRRIAPMQ